MEERDPVAVVFTGLFKAVRFAVLAFAWIIIGLCVATKNR